MSREQELQKKNAILRREISHLHGKINQLKNRLKVSDNEIGDLKNKVKTLEKALEKCEEEKRYLVRG